MEEENKGGRPIVWTEDRIDIMCTLFERFLNKDQFFEDEDYEDIAKVVPILAHFVSIVGEKWEIIRGEYPELADVKRPPSKMTLLQWDDMKPLVEILHVRQERGLLYGSISGMLSGSTPSLMLQNHGYTGKQEIEHSVSKDAYNNLKDLYEK